MIRRYLEEVKYQYKVLGSMLDSSLEVIAKLTSNVDQLLYLIAQKERQDAENNPKEPDPQG